MDIREHSTGRRRQPWQRLRRGAIAVFTVLVVAALCGQAATADTSGGLGIHAIRHVIVVMMENRSFDSFFGTYPGADGLPRSHGRFTSCLPDPQIHHCQRPWHDRRFINGGAAHGSVAFANDFDHGRMDGFVAQAENRNQDRWCADSAAAVCSVNANIDVMGYHTAREIPAYWSYAKHFVLDDHMFEPVGAWSGVAHLFEVSEWSASCSNGWAPMSCKAYIRDGWWPDVTGTAIFCALSPVLHVLHLAPGCTPEAQAPPPDFAWTDMTYLLYKRGVSWGYFVTPGGAPDCENGSATCQSTQVSPGSDSVWNPLPSFATVRQDNQLGNIQTTSQFLTLAQQGELPAVSWVVPDQPHSDHPPADLRGGQAFVANIVNTVASGPDWNSTAIFLAWDDWGGFYDNVRPPKVGGYRFGFRVPALIISPYARRGFIDHQAMSFDAYNKFIEDDFLGGQRLNPRTDGRPDSRPNVREDLPDTGDLARDFNFNQRPLPPLILPLYPRGRPHL